MSHHITADEKILALVKMLNERDQTIKELREALKEQQEAFTSMTSNATAFKFWQDLKSKNEELRERIEKITAETHDLGERMIAAEERSETVNSIAQAVYPRVGTKSRRFT